MLSSSPTNPSSSPPTRRIFGSPSKHIHGSPTKHFHGSPTKPIPTSLIKPNFASSTKAVSGSPTKPVNISSFNTNQMESSSNSFQRTFLRHSSRHLFRLKNLNFSQSRCSSLDNINRPSSSRREISPASPKLLSTSEKIFSPKIFRQMSLQRTSKTSMPSSPISPSRQIPRPCLSSSCSSPPPRRSPLTSSSSSSTPSPRRSPLTISSSCSSPSCRHPPLTPTSSCFSPPPPSASSCFSPPPPSASSASSSPPSASSASSSPSIIRHNSGTARRRHSSMPLTLNETIKNNLQKWQQLSQEFQEVNHHLSQIISSSEKSGRVKSVSEHKKIYRGPSVGLDRAYIDYIHSVEEVRQALDMESKEATTRALQLKRGSTMAFRKIKPAAVARINSYESGGSMDSIEHDESLLD